MNQKGQTAIEYMLMLAVVCSIAITFFKKANEILLTSNNSYIQNYLNSYKKILKSDPNYRKFTLPK